MNNYVLGLNVGNHDSAAALIKNGEVTCFIEQERISRHKMAIGEAPVDAVLACLQREQITDELMAHVRQLNDEAKEQGLTLAQYALRYLLRQEGVTSVIIGASSVEQLDKNLQTISNL